MGRHCASQAHASQQARCARVQACGSDLSIRVFRIVAVRPLLLLGQLGLLEWQSHGGPNRRTAPPLRTALPDSSLGCSRTALSACTIDHKSGPRRRSRCAPMAISHGLRLRSKHHIQVPSRAGRARRTRLRGRRCNNCVTPSVGGRFSCISLISSAQLNLISLRSDLQPRRKRLSLPCLRNGFASQGAISTGDESSARMGGTVSMRCSQPARRLASHGDHGSVASTA